MNINFSTKYNQLYISIWLMLVVGCSSAIAKVTEPVNGEEGVNAREIALGLGVPWGMAFISGQEMLITERQGALKKLNIYTGELVKITGAPTVVSHGQGGFLDIVTSPSYTRDKWLYMTYSKKNYLIRH